MTGRVRWQYKALLWGVLALGVVMITLAEVFQAVSLGVMGGSLVGCVALRTLQLLDVR